MVRGGRPVLKGCQCLITGPLRLQKGLRELWAIVEVHAPVFRCGPTSPVLISFAIPGSGKSVTIPFLIQFVLLPPTTECGKAMFSVMSFVLCGTPHVTTHGPVQSCVLRYLSSPKLEVMLTFFQMQREKSVTVKTVSKICNVM